MDGAVRAHIEELVAEEARIEAGAASAPLMPQDIARLREIEVELDRQWDLLRQRRARRDAGGNPDEAEIRSGRTVENYVE